MPENVNTSVLEIESELADDSSKKTMIRDCRSEARVTL